jgi:hypothetical protein
VQYCSVYSGTLDTLQSMRNYEAHHLRGAQIVFHPHHSARNGRVVMVEGPDHHLLAVSNAKRKKHSVFQASPGFPRPR